jgi:hypothetical protein
MTETLLEPVRIDPITWRYRMSRGAAFEGMAAGLGANDTLVASHASAPAGGVGSSTVAGAAPSLGSRGAASGRGAA